MVDWVLVSGGAGGIGSAVVSRLAAAGRRCLIGYVGAPDPAARLAEETGGRPLALDLTDPARIDAALDEAKAALGAGDVLSALVLAASPPPTLGPFGRIAAEDLDLQLRVNAIGPRHLLAGVARTFFRPRRSGVVVAVLSGAMGGDDAPAMPNMGAYVIAKHALSGVLAAAAGEYAWLRVARVRPGFTETPMLDAFDPRFLEQRRAARPFSTPETVAEEICAPILEAPR